MNAIDPTQKQPIPSGHYACYGCGKVHPPEKAGSQCKKPCRGCGMYHGLDSAQIKCLTEALEGVLASRLRERQEHQRELAALRAANRAAVVAASLPTSKGGLAETRKNAGGG
jgi:hypothetical protein